MSPAQPESAPPSPATSQPPRLFRIGRVQIAVNVLVQFLAVLTLVLMGNYLSFRHHKTLDWSSTGRYTLSEDTKYYLKQLQEPCKAYFFLANKMDGRVSDVRDQVTAEVAALLHEYDSQSNRKLIFEAVDNGVDTARGRELQTKYDTDGSENLVILDYKGDFRSIDLMHLAQYERVTGRTEKGEEEYVFRIKSFDGENFITSALIRLLQGKPSKVYCVFGHGEFTVGNQNFQTALKALQFQNFELEDLALAGIEQVPEDTDAIFIGNPERDFSDRDLQVLSDYWDRKGRIFVALAPDHKTEKLTAWLRKRGVILQGDKVIFIEKKGENKYDIRPAEGVFTANSPISRPLKGHFTGFAGYTQSIMFDEAMMKSGDMVFWPLVATMPGSNWYGETDPISNDRLPLFDPNKDHRSPLILAIATEKGAPNDPTLQLDNPRLVVVGNGLFLNDVMLEEKAAPLNKDLLVNSLKWLSHRDVKGHAHPREQKANDLHLSVEDVHRFAIVLIIILPLSIALIGLYYLSWRHGRNLLLVSAVVIAVGLCLWGLEALLVSANHEPVARTENQETAKP